MDTLPSRIADQEQATDVALEGEASVEVGSTILRKTTRETQTLDKLLGGRRMRSPPG